MKRLIINTLLFLVLSYIVPGFVVTSWQSALIATIVYAIAKVVVGIPLKVISFPLTFLTFGLFNLVINGVVVVATSFLVPGFEIESFFLAMFVAVVFSVIDAILFKDEG